MGPAHCFTRRGASPTHDKSMLNGGEHPRVLLPHPQPAHLMLGGKGHVGAGINEKSNMYIDKMLCHLTFCSPLRVFNVLRLVASEVAYSQWLH